MTIIGEEMKPCPFCGGEARTLPALRRVFCTTPDCGAEIRAITQARAIMLWNTRRPEVWQPIEEMRWPIERPVIVTDGADVYGAGWWHPREQAWLDCDGITPTHWKPLPEPPVAALSKVTVV